MKTTIVAIAVSLFFAGFAFADNAAPAPVSTPGSAKVNPCMELNQKVIAACEAAGYKVGAAKDKTYMAGKGGLFRHCVNPLEKSGKWPAHLPKDAVAKADLKACKAIWVEAGKRAKKMAPPSGAAASAPAAGSGDQK